MTLFGSPVPKVGKDDLPLGASFETFYPFIRGAFSQWHYTPFVCEGQQCATAEQWMMYGKALLFGDEFNAQKIMATDDPALQKRLGQQVQGFESEIWDVWKVDIVYQGNVAKFEQNRGALRQLRNTENAMLVEANPRDWIWGIGRSIEDPDVHVPSNWRGENLLGRILTKVRSDLS